MHVESFIKVSPGLILSTAKRVPSSASMYARMFEGAPRSQLRSSTRSLNSSPRHGLECRRIQISNNAANRRGETIPPSRRRSTARPAQSSAASWASPSPNRCLPGAWRLPANGWTVGILGAGCDSLRLTRIRPSRWTHHRPTLWILLWRSPVTPTQKRTVQAGPGKAAMAPGQTSVLAR